MNWRVLGGLALLLAGIAELYTVTSNPVKPGSSRLYAELGCGVWMAAGIFLIIRGSGKKEN